MSHWDNFGTEKLWRCTWEVQKRQGDIQVCLTQLCGNTVLMLLQLQFETEPAVLLRQNTNTTMAFQLSVCLRPCTAACQARSPLEYAYSAVQTAWLQTPSDITHPHFEPSSWGMTSYKSHPHTAFQICFYPGWQMNAVLPVVLPVSKLLSYSVCSVQES